MTAPQVSVVLPTHDRPALLRQAIRSALGQEGVEIEVIVVDDASSDDTPALLAAIGDPRLKVVRHGTGTGPAVARNHGIEHAGGRWIAFLDDDDFFAPDKLRVQIEDAERLDRSFSYTGRIEIDDRDTVIQRRLMSEDHDLAVHLLDDNVVGGPSAVVVRSELLDEIGGFDERLPPLEDWDLWIRAASTGPAAVRREPLYAYRRHAGNFWVTAAAEIPGSFDVLREKHREAAARAGVEFGSGWIVRRDAARDVASGHRLRAARRLVGTAAAQRNPRDLARAVVALGGGAARRLGMSAASRFASRPEWLDRITQGPGDAGEAN